MNGWSVAVVDTGVTDETEAVYGASLFDYDYYGNDADTDAGRTTSHGSRVAEAVEATNSSLERLDMQVVSNGETNISTYAIHNALLDITNLSDEGWSIGAVNMSMGSYYSSWVSDFQTNIALLASRGVFTVASAGNGGSSFYTEYPTYPARLSYTISVGSHDGSGNPTWFSQNRDGGVHILADGEDFPGTGDNGTSFAAPQVAATVASMQALVETTTGDRLSFDEVVDALQVGGAGPRSAVDPADNATTYFLLDHNLSVNYVLDNYVDPAFSGLEYIASYSDIEATYGRDATAARDHLIGAGVWEGREVSFDGLEYLASYEDLRAVFGTDRHAAAGHYLDAGRAEGRTVTFDAEAYMTANPDVARAFNYDNDQATLHYITAGAAEGRATEGEAPATESRAAVSEGSVDLARSTDTTGYVGIGQSVTGTITSYDRDWFETEFFAGETVIIQARGSASGGGTLFDPELRVYDLSGNYLTYNWDSGAGRDAYLAYTPTTSGTHYLEVDGYWLYTGTYTLEVASASTSSIGAFATGAELADRVPESFEDVQASILADGPPPLDPFGLL